MSRVNRSEERVDRERKNSPTQMTTKCTWKPNGKADPHRHEPYQTGRQRILNNILERIGDTPLVRLNRIPQAEGVKCDVLVKCEFFNAGGSVKDRIGKRMVEEAERDGRLKPNCTIIEPTSGNTGIGLALAAAVKGYRAIITMPEKMSQEKVDVLRALGAEIVRTPTEAAFDSPESHIGVAKRLNKEIPDSVILDQYANPYNPIAHYDGTAEEILEACGGQLDMFVAGAGTGGTLTGIARKIKEKCPSCVIVGVDPHGSILAQPPELNGEISSYKVEGIGYDFIPDVLDRSLIDKWVKSNDTDSFQYARRLIREEGILCGGSSGCALWAAMQVAKSLKPGQKCVVLLADSVRNYMTKFLNDEWMRKNKFLAEKPSMVVVDEEKTPSSTQHPLRSPVGDESLFDFGDITIQQLNLPKPICVSSITSCKEAAALMSSHNFSQLPVVSTGTSSTLVGMITMGQILSKVAHKICTMDDPVTKIMFKFNRSNNFVEVRADWKVKRLLPFFDSHSVAVVTDEKGEVVCVVTKFDLVEFLLHK